LRETTYLLFPGTSRQGLVRAAIAWWIGLFFRFFFPRNRLGKNWEYPAFIPVSQNR
jgi:hypothetical protein